MALSIFGCSQRRSLRLDLAKTVAALLCCGREGLARRCVGQERKARLRGRATGLRFWRVGTLRFAREAESYPLITHVVLCGMSIAKEPSGSPDGVGFEMQANGSFPVIPLYLPVPPVMI